MSPQLQDVRLKILKGYTLGFSALRWERRPRKTPSQSENVRTKILNFGHTLGFTGIRWKRQPTKMPSHSQDLRMKILNFGYTLGFTRFRWDSSAQALRISPSRIRSAWIKIQLLLVLIYEMFLVYQAAKPVKDGCFLDQLQKIDVAGFWILSSCYNIASVHTSEYVELINKLSEYKRKFKSLKPKTRRRSQKFTKIVAFISVFVTATVTMKALGGSSSPALLTSLINTDREENRYWLLWRLGATFFHFTTNGFHMFGGWVHWTSIDSFSVDVSHMIEEAAPRKGRHDSDYAAANAFARTHRSLQLLQEQFASFYGNLMSALQLIGICCVVINTYQAVVIGSVRSLVLALGIAYGFAQVLERTAEVYHTSSDVLHEWRQVNRGDVPLWFPRFWKSCRFLCIPVGRFFYVDRGLVLTVLSIMLDNSASLILTFG